FFLARPLAAGIADLVTRGNVPTLLDGLAHITLPAITLGVLGTAYVSRMVRSAVLDILNEDYVRTARAKGLSQARVIVKHVLRNAMLPVITVIGLQFGVLLGSAVVTETVF